MALDLHAPVEQLALALVDIPSVSGDEKALADVVEEALAALPHLTVERIGNNVVARTDLGRATRVVLAGHLDTVPIKDNVPGAIADGILTGRGSVDMKGGVAVHLSLAAALTEPMHDVTYVVYDQEEVEESRNGLGLVSRERPDLLAGDFAILGEPTSAAIEGGCNGTLRVDVASAGVAAHSARAWKGVNAIHGAAPLLAALAAYTPATVTVDGLDYREGLNAVGIRGGIAGNVIPDECVVSVNYRFAPDKDADTALALVEAIVRAAGPYEVTVTDLAGGARPGLDAPMAQEFAALVEGLGGGAPRAKVGWTDVARFGSLGIPAVNFGPGDPELAHADDERCPVDDILRCREALMTWLGGPR